VTTENTNPNQKDESQLVRHGPCSSCNSSDAVGVYDDGHGYCFSCDTFHSDYDKVAETPQKATEEYTNHSSLANVTYSTLHKRKVSEETCRFWQYEVGEYNGRPVQIANYFTTEGERISKIRFPDKDFLVLGKGKLPLYGSQLWQNSYGRSAKMVVVTEGEIDAMSVSQLMENRWPVVSVPNGAAGAVKAFKENLEWLQRYESVIIMFDNDKVGQEAADKCSQVLAVGKAKIANLPLKDANDMLVAGRGKELINAVWNAKSWRPDGIVSGSDLWDIINKDDSCMSHMYPWNGLNTMTHGLREGEIVTLCAGSGIGKSAICKEFAYHLLSSKQTIGYIALEESTKRTALGLMGLHMNKPIFLNPQDHDEAEKKAAFDATVGSGNYYAYDHWGSLGEENLLSKIRYLVTSVGCKIIFLDHISIVVSGMEGGDERRMIDNTMTKLRSLVEELSFGLVLVSHLKRPDGKGHEEGARTTLAQLRGSASIAQLSDIVIGLERDQQNPETSHLTTVRILKNRWSGQTGNATWLEYSEETGRLNETEPPEDADDTNDF
jgi:twinkle protein